MDPVFFPFIPYFPFIPNGDLLEHRTREDLTESLHSFDSRVFSPTTS